jgi:glycosyltransferase involved in cell wall biosynthesis
MKILHIIASVDPAGGGPIEGVVRQDAACSVAGILGSREVVTLDPPDAPFLARYPLVVHALGRPRSGSRLLWRRALEHWRYSAALVPWLRANLGRYDVVIVNGLWNYAAFGAARVLPGGPTPYFVFTHGMMDPWFRVTYPLKHLAKQVFWLMGEGRLLAGARSVFFTCEEERRKARNQFRGYGPYDETVVGYGASAPPPSTPALETAFRAAAPGLGDRPYLLFLSRIHRKKGCDLLIEAFARVADAHPGIDLVMAGPDQSGLRPALEALAEQRGVASRVHWTGPLYGDAKWGAMYGADAFALPSHQENFGIAVAEALGCGTPVLISDQIDIWREIEAAGAGFVGPDTVEGTEAVLRRWLDMDKPDRARAAMAAKTLFSEQFDVARAGPALIETIRGRL